MNNITEFDNFHPNHISERLTALKCIFRTSVFRSASLKNISAFENNFKVLNLKIIPQRKLNFASPVSMWRCHMSSGVREIDLNIYINGNTSLLTIHQTLMFSSYTFMVSFMSTTKVTFKVAIQMISNYAFVISINIKMLRPKL